MISLARDIIDATRPSDTVDCFVVGRLKARVFGIRVPVRLSMYLLTGIWLTRQQLLGAMTEEG